MSTDRDLFNALKKAASKLMHRTITEDDERQLAVFFNVAEGTSYQQTINSLKSFYSLATLRRDLSLLEETDSVRPMQHDWESSPLILEEATQGVSDDTDRMMQDLKNALKDWKK